jgi:hypothetical protein
VANVFERCALKSGEIFLVNDDSSGIGTTEIQIYSAMRAFHQLDDLGLLGCGVSHRRPRSPLSLDQ